MEQPISPYPTIGDPTIGQPVRSDRVILVRHSSDAIRDQVFRWGRRIEAFVTENPGVSLGIAITFGVVLGWLIKRR
jgi:ElaB/YqjD/DUF883 family membrane-anchored ribosome-binding protein